MPTDASTASGWVDTHLHLLPGLDDGPATMEDSLALAEAAIADGTAVVAATPHANYQFEFRPHRVRELCNEMQAKLGSRLRITSGCEVHLSYENLQRAMAEPALYSLNGGRYILVEFPEFFERHALANALEQLLHASLVPVLAHPERNPVFQQHPDALDDYLRMGCLGQVTASSFTGRFGKRAQQFSGELLHGHRIHIVASDGHAADRRPPHFRKAFDVIVERASEEVALALCRDNPLAVVENRDLPYYPEPPKEKKKGLLARLRA